MPDNNQHDAPFLNRPAAMTAALVATAAAAAVALAASGCDSKGDTTPAPYGAPAASAAMPSAPADAPSTAPSTAAAPPAAAPPAADQSGGTMPAPPMAAGGNAPMMGMGANPTAPLSPTPELDAAIAKADASKDKKAIGKAYAARGTFRMNDEKAGARVKYRAALEDYRKALAADPANAEAKSNKDMIEGIYRSMGRPIPGADGK